MIENTTSELMANANMPFFFNQLYERLVDHGMSLLYELLGFFSDERQNPLDGLKEENSKMIQGCFLLGIFWRFIVDSVRAFFKIHLG